MALTNEKFLLKKNQKTNQVQKIQMTLLITIYIYGLFYQTVNKILLISRLKFLAIIKFSLLLSLF